MTSVNTQTHISSLLLLINDEFVHINDESHLFVSYDEEDLFIYVWAPFYHGSHINVIYVWAMTCHWRVSHESRHVHAHTCTSHGTHINKAWHKYAWVMSHTWMSHVTHMHQSCHTNLWVMSHIHGSCHTHSWVMSHTFMSHVARMHESWHTYAWGMAHTRMRHVTHVNACCTYVCVCNMTLSYVYHNSRIYVTGLAHVRGITSECVWHDSWMCVIRLFRTCIITRTYIWRHSYMRVACLINKWTHW